MERRIAPSRLLEEEITDVLLAGVDDSERLAEVGRLGARLVLQRAVDEEVESFLARARYERTPEARGWRNGHRPRRIQTAEGEIGVAMPQVRGTVELRHQHHPRHAHDRPHAAPGGAHHRRLRPRPLRPRHESLLKEAGLGHVSRSAVSVLCRELRSRYLAFCARDLSGVELLALFPDAVYLKTRPRGQKEGVLGAWGYTLSGERALVAVRLGLRERYEDWLDLGRDLAKRSLRTPWLVASDGAPGLVNAIEELWPAADRQRCTVHRLRNILAKLPKQDTWGELEPQYPSAAACLADDLEALCVHLRYPGGCASACAPRTCSNAPWRKYSGG